MSSTVVSRVVPLAKSESRRVVVTGMGLVCCLGVGVEHVWQRLSAGDCGITSINWTGYEKIPSKVAGLVPRGDKPGQLSLDKIIPPSEQRMMSTGASFALVAAQEALEQAKWKPATLDDKQRTGVAVGIGMPNLEDIAEAAVTLQQKGYNKVSPFFIPIILPNIPAGRISLKYGLQGPNHCVSTACATGLHAIGDAFKFIKHGVADVMVCGSTEAVIGPLAMTGFARLKALSTQHNDHPMKASCPFDKERDGFVMAEGAGIVVLEEHEHACTRKADIYGEILGYGLSGDANHITAPRDDGQSASLCMTAALKDAGIAVDDVGYINAHATSTPLGDIAESRAIRSVFGSHSEKLLISSNKGSVGHLLGAAGSVETIFAIMACHTGVVPPTINLNHPDEQCGNLNFVPNFSQNWSSNYKLRIGITNSFGFGGTNGSLCVSQYKETVND